ncbi:MAG: hypothetical protein EPO45_20210 [Sphingobium sp.]|nr:MAG: hypothetical protein EPO45_20210 [Sphingobium sp.]
MKRLFERVGKLRGRVRSIVYKGLVDDDSTYWQRVETEQPRINERIVVKHDAHWDQTSERDAKILALFDSSNIDASNWRELKVDRAFWHEIVQALDYVDWDYQWRDNKGVLNITQRVTLVDVYSVLGQEIAGLIEQSIDETVDPLDSEASEALAKDLFMRYITLYDQLACQNFLVLYARYRLLKGNAFSWQQFELFERVGADNDDERDPYPREIQPGKTRFSVQYNTDELDYVLYSTLTVRDKESLNWNYTIYVRPGEEYPRLDSSRSPTPVLYIALQMPTAYQNRTQTLRVETRRPISSVLKFYYEGYLYLCCSSSGTADGLLIKVHRSLVTDPPFEYLIIEPFGIDDFDQWRDVTFIDEGAVQSIFATNKRAVSSLSELIATDISRFALLTEYEEEGPPQDMTRLERLLKRPMGLRLLGGDDTVEDWNQFQVLGCRIVKLPLERHPTLMYVAALSRRYLDEHEPRRWQYNLYIFRYSELKLVEPYDLSYLGETRFILGPADDLPEAMQIWDLDLLFFTPAHFYVQITYKIPGSSELHTRNSAWYALDPDRDFSFLHAKEPLAWEDVVDVVPDANLVTTLKNNHYYAFDMRHSFNLAQTADSRFDVVYFKRDYAEKRARFVFYKIHARGLSAVGDLYVRDIQRTDWSRVKLTLPKILGFARIPSALIPGNRGLCLIRTKGVRMFDDQHSIRYFMVVDFKGRDEATLDDYESGEFDLASATQQACALCGHEFKARIMHQSTGEFYCETVCHSILKECCRMH